jgi:hypothetical protein
MRAMGDNCWAHKHRELVPIEVHHVWPVGNGGPNVKENKVSLCANAHSFHSRSAGEDGEGGHRRAVPWLVRRRYGRKVRRLASAGFQAIKTRLVVTP